MKNIIPLKTIKTSEDFGVWTKKRRLSKTLRFELKPAPETQPFLNNFVSSDKQRDKDYKELKEIADEYHKHYIEESLSECVLREGGLKELERWNLELKKLKEYKEKEKIKQKAVKLQAELRKQVTKSFKNKTDLFGKKFLSDLLPEYLEKTNPADKEQKKRIIEKFKNFSTYLKGYNENRKNIYSDKERCTAISHRIINENLPKFFSNKQNYEKTVKEFPGLKDKFEDIKTELKEERAYLKAENMRDVFSLTAFNKCLSQKGIESYNALIGGKRTKGGRKIQGLNEKINKYRQQNSLKRRKAPDFEFLHKQILSDREKRSFLPEAFENREALAKAVKEFWKEISEPQDWTFFPKKTDLLSGIKALFSKNLSENDFSGMYFKNSELSCISSCLFDDWSFIKSALKRFIENKVQSGSSGAKGRKKSQSALEKEKERLLKKEFFSFQEIEEALSDYRGFLDGEEKEKIRTDKNNIRIYFERIFQQTGGGDKKSRLFENLKNQAPDPDLLRKFYDSHVSKVLQSVSEKDSSFSKDETERLKVFLDSLQNFLQAMRPVRLEKGGKNIEPEGNKDIAFYSQFNEFYDALSPVTALYNKCRNFIAEKRSRMKKIKINFENSQLLDGWDVNKETACLSVILRKKEKSKGGDFQWMYYLGVMDKEHKGVFDKRAKKRKKELKEKMSVKKEYYEKMNYKLLPGPDKMLPKVFFSEKRRRFFSPSEDILKIRNNKTYAKNDGENFNLKDCHKLIDFYKRSIDNHDDWKRFNFKFSPTSEYRDISDFYHEAASQGYKLSFDKIRADYIQERVRSGALYLFQIYNKDFSRYSKGRPNLHTTYFKMLFDKENLKDTVFKMSGGAEIFYRKASLKNPIIHKKNQPVKNKNPLNKRKYSEFPYDIKKDRRFTKNKFFFHLPVVLNFKEKDQPPRAFNQEVLSFLKGNKNINIIGVDRGERRLAYYTVINQKGVIADEGSFNQIKAEYKNKKGEKVPVWTDYHRLLDQKEKERDTARKSWTEIENIKELKAGCISHLVYQISRLMIKHNAVVVLEDLNKGFKRGRIKFEKQIYQMEKALIDKLNYLVFKERDPLKPGGCLNGFQLTAPFESFQKMSAQTGFVFLCSSLLHI